MHAGWILLLYRTRRWQDPGLPPLPETKLPSPRRRGVSGEVDKRGNGRGVRSRWAGARPTPTLQCRVLIKEAYDGASAATTSRTYAKHPSRRFTGGGRSNFRHRCRRFGLGLGEVHVRSQRHFPFARSRRQPEPPNEWAISLGFPRAFHVSRCTSHSLFARRPSGWTVLRAVSVARAIARYRKQRESHRIG